jgi:peptidoglycan/LPS O-acetylase OafA/YrhL
MQYRREVDGLRALAVLPVIFFHAGFGAFRGGFVGVDIFFVISGYLITSILIAEASSNTYSLINFYERRARRILPALFVVMFTCLPFAWAWMTPQELKGLSQSVAAVCAFASNIYFWRYSGYFESASELKPLLHTWSLAVEEQFYLFFPVLIAIIWRYGRRWVWGMLGLIALGSLLWLRASRLPIALLPSSCCRHAPGNYLLVRSLHWPLRSAIKNLAIS